MSKKQSQTKYENDIKFQNLCAEYRNAYPQVSKKAQQAGSTKLWNEIKSKSREYEDVIRELKQKAAHSKAKLTSLFIKAQTVQKKRATSAEDSSSASTSTSAAPVSSSASAPVSSSASAPASSSTSSPSTSTAPVSSSASTLASSSTSAALVSAPASASAATASSSASAAPSSSSASAPVVSLKRKAPAPMQEKLKQEIADKNQEIASYLVIQGRTGLTVENKKRLDQLNAEKTKCEQKLKRKQVEQQAQQRLREKKAKTLQEIKEDHPDISDKITKLQVRKGVPGRPPIEESQAGLHQAILSIIMPESGADERRRTEIYQSVKTLDGLKSALIERGYTLSRTATYYRLLPASARHTDAKRHVYTVPVKLCKAQNDLRKPHMDGHFAMASVKHANELAAMFSAENVFYLSQDDKARVPIGLPVSQRQTALLMHVEYKVKLPDHTFPIGEKHKLIPSVYASCLKNKDGSIGYSGPTYIAIRSGKHDKSTSASHLEDFKTLIRWDSLK